MRWLLSRPSVMYGHLYGGRAKSFPVEPGQSFLKVCRYVERSPSTARAAASAREYPRSSLCVREHGTAEQKRVLRSWPTARPGNWLRRVNEPITAKEREAWRLSLDRTRPFGEDD